MAYDISGTLRLNLDVFGWTVFQRPLSISPGGSLLKARAVFVFVWRRRTSRSVIFRCGIWRPCRGACLSLNITNMFTKSYKHIDSTWKLCTKNNCCICGAATASFADSRVEHLCGLSADSVASHKRTGWNGHSWSLLPKCSCYSCEASTWKAFIFRVVAPPIFGVVESPILLTDLNQAKGPV